MLLGIIGIILSLILLMTLAYRGVPVVIAAPISAIVALVFSGAPILASYTEIFMPALAGFVGSYFPLFLLGAIFGILMTTTGYAEHIATTVARVLGARSALLATVVTSALMTYGGISLFVVAFVMYPLARELFRVADIPRRLIPATIALGIFTFTMTALPGSPQVQNIIPGQFFGTNGFAAPGVGLLGTAMILGLGMAWLEYRRSSMIRNGEHFGSEVPTRTGLFALRAGRSRRSGSERAQGGGRRDREHGTTRTETSVETKTSVKEEQRGSSGSVAVLSPANGFVAFVPLLVVFVVNFGCTLWLFPAMDWSYLQEEQFGSIALSSRAGVWAVIVALTAAILSIVALNFREFGALKQSFVDGVKGSLLPIFSVSSEVAYGAVIASVAAFAVVRDAIFNAGGNALVTSVLSTSVTAAITGSSSGGMTIALNAFGEQLRTMAVDQGVSLEAMHRLTAMAAGGLDTLPHSGAVITLLLVCGLTHRQSYKDMAMVTIVAPVVTVAVLVLLVSLVGSF
ncbi:GntP family permease [Kocuria coralli]|uniref:GntP family permease n=1 Tax=Kocuria coralli TaxID=1461025 RepID=A0A5J5L0Y3_9MICC|nr:GntP family permease [Kocuria coralli]KAA9395597.1 GntP family permease [Kocuria coralli]